MTSCDDIERSLVSEDGGAAVRAHLATCERCRGFEAAHRAALRARHLEPAVRALPRRAGVLRRASVAAALVGALLTAGALSVRGSTPTGEPGAPSGGSTVAVEPEAAVPGRARVVERSSAPATETGLSATAPEPHPEWLALAEFTHALDATVYRDVIVSDDAYASFGALPRWFAPRSPLTALEN
ncbi:MAG: hypothetical protein INH41_09100 [Myxococcaceae bacterium]|jgi:hypothetical protein|nr:hypothetical protein [Myxococcaceae bacterium]MCA3012541.1 hypothetical protein [Myxococcaceae bacterium]